MLTTILCATLMAAAPAPDSSQEETHSVQAVESAPLDPMRTRASLMIGVGGTLALSGAVLWIVGNVQEGTTASVRRNAVELPEAQRSAQRIQLGGMALTLVGACALGVSAVMWSWAPEQRPGPVSAAFMVAPGGGGVSLEGTFP